MCTGIRFSDAAGNMYFGRNLDWECSYGERPIVVPRGHVIRWAFDEPSASPRAIVGMGVVGEGLPLYFDCANEDGLAVAGLNFPHLASYAPEPVDGRTNVAAYELPLWVASRFASVDEVEQALEKVCVVAKSAGEGLGVANLHWFIGDARRSIVLECRTDGMRVFHDDVDVLTNQPGFDWHLENLRNYITATVDDPAPATWGRATLAPFGAGAGTRGIPGDAYPPSRFVKAAFVNANYPQKDTEEENVTRLFRALSSVAMVEGMARMADGSFEKTVYTGGYSTRTRRYYWSTYDDPTLRSVALDDYAAAGTDLVLP